MLPSAIRKQKSFNVVPAISLGELLFTDTDLSLPKYSYGCFRYRHDQFLGEVKNQLK